MPAEQPSFPLVLVEWEDAYNGNHDWFGIGALPDVFAPVICRTVGWLVREHAARLTLAMTVTDHGRGAEGTLCDLFTIPRGCIRATTLLTNAWEGGREGLVDKLAGQPGIP